MLGSPGLPFVVYSLIRKNEDDICLEPNGRRSKVLPLPEQEPRLYQIMIDNPAKRYRPSGGRGAQTDVPDKRQLDGTASISFKPELGSEAVLTLPIKREPGTVAALSAPEPAPPSTTLIDVNCLIGKYNPEKLADVPTLAAKYGEEQLRSMVRRKYAEREAAGADSVAIAAPRSSPAIETTLSVPIKREPGRPSKSKPGPGVPGARKQDSGALFNKHKLCSAATPSLPRKRQRAGPIVPPPPRSAGEWVACRSDMAEMAAAMVALSGGTCRLPPRQQAAPPRLQTERGSKLYNTED